MLTKLKAFAVVAALTAGTSTAAMAQYACPWGYTYYNGVCQPVPGYSNPVSCAASGEEAGAANGYATGGPVGAIVGGALGTAAGALTGTANTLSCDAGYTYYNSACYRPYNRACYPAREGASRAAASSLPLCHANGIARGWLVGWLNLTNPNYG